MNIYVYIEEKLHCETRKFCREKYDTCRMKEQHT